MKNEDKTKEQLINELREMRKKIAKFEESEKKYALTLESLRESEEKCTSLIENIPLGVSISTPKGEILYINSYFWNMFGFNSKEEVVNTPAIALWHDPEERKKFVTELKERGIVKEFTTQFNFKDGSPFWGSVNATILNTKTGPHIIVAIQDISERKLIEAEIIEKAENLARFNAELKATEIINIMSDKLFTMDLNGKVIDKELAFEELTGYKKNEMIGNEALNLIRKIIKPDDFKNAFKNFESTLKGRTLNEELEQRAEERAKVLKAAQEVLIRKEKLAAVGKLAASVGHELRNPLGVINNSIYYLNMKLKDVDEKVLRHLSIIEKEVQRSNKIITDLLDFARVRTLNLENSDINLLIKETIANNNIPTNITLKLDFDVNLPLILLDSISIQQVFQNIISNAIQAMPEGGNLKIKTLKNNIMVKIMFGDTGVGIPKENFQKIFEPLFTTKTTGIGLGLTIVKDIIELHNGKIEVESEVGVGTTFSINLPINRE